MPLLVPHKMLAQVVKLSQKPKFYITTAISYTNGPPHFGHAYEAIVADVIARYHRVLGDDVFFLTGTDEHGQKVADTAHAAGLRPIELCDKNVSLFKKLHEKLDISPNDFIRTTSEKHIKTCKWIWNEVARAKSTSEPTGDIYLGEYSGWYSILEEKFLAENEAKRTDYKDPLSGKPYTKKRETSWFFRLSKYQNQITAHIRQNPEFVQPEEFRNEILCRLENEPLLDLSISREKFDWGIPVPDCAHLPKTEQRHVIYVWFDALTNYLSGVEFPNSALSRFWPADVHLIGKDISWFHAVIWPAMLLSAGIPLPKKILCHGFINGPDGRKMSKSIGNVIDLDELSNQFSSDCIRYFVIREPVFGKDFNFSTKSLTDLHDYELGALFGNLVNRVIVFTRDYLGGIIPYEPCEEIYSIEELKKNIDMEFQNFRLQNALEYIVRALKLTDQYYTKKKPWELPEEKSKKIVLRTVLESLYVCCHYLSAVTPRAASEVFSALNSPMKFLGELNEWKNLIPGTPISRPKILFNRIRNSRHDQHQQQEQEEEDVISLWDIFVGRIISCEINSQNNSFFNLEADIGNTSDGKKSLKIVSEIAKFYHPEKLIGKLIVVVANVTPKYVHGINSEGIILGISSRVTETAKSTTTTDHVDFIIELISPPDGVIPGEKIYFDDFPQNNSPKQRLTNHVIKKTKKFLGSNDFGIVGYKNIPFKTSAGYCSVNARNSNIWF